MITTRLLLTKRFPGNNEMGRECIRVHADVGGKVVKFEEAITDNQIERLFDSLFLHGKAHPIRGHVEGDLGGSEHDSQQAYEAVLSAVNERLTQSVH